MNKNLILLLVLCACLSHAGAAQILIPDHVFDGDRLHAGIAVFVQDGKIAGVGTRSELDIPEGSQEILLEGMTLMPGMIEGHSHLLLHPYNEASWNDQVLRQSRSLRVARGTVHAERTLLAGFTTIRDLGSEGADYADIGLRDAIAQGIIPGPTVLAAGRAIVATGSYGPKGFHPDFDVPLGAEAADAGELVRVTRDQIGNGADVIKIYADYRWGPSGEARPSFSVDEIRTVVEITTLSGRDVVAHAATAEGMMNAIAGGVRSIEHGDGATTEVFQAMLRNNVTWYPTLGAVEAISSYGGWTKGVDPDPERIARKKTIFRQALRMGVSIGMGSDVGVFPHGDNAWELELMVEYGMTPQQALRAVTLVNAETFGIENKVGAVRTGLDADLIAVGGNPVENISATRDVRFVMKQGRVVLRPDNN